MRYSDIFLQTLPHPLRGDLRCVDIRVGAPCSNGIRLLKLAHSGAGATVLILHAHLRLLSDLNEARFGVILVCAVEYLRGILEDGFFNLLSVNRLPAKLVQDLIVGVKHHILETVVAVQVLFAHLTAVVRRVSDFNECGGLCIVKVVILLIFENVIDNRLHISQLSL